MNRKDVTDAIDKIDAAPGAQERIYHEIVRKGQDKSYVSKKKLHFFKLKMDKAMPWAAVCVVLLFCFCFYGVTSGLFTGAPYISDKTLAGDMASAEEEKAALPQEAPNAVAGGGQAESATEGGAVTYSGENAVANDREKDAGSAEIRALVTAWAAIDVGFTTYQISDVPADPFLFWDELRRIGAAPAGIQLDGYNLDGTALTLNFDGNLQKMLDASTTSYFVTAMAKSFYGLYPELTSLVIQSESSPVTFQGTAVDAAALAGEQISVTDTYILVYGEEFQQQ